MHAPGNEPCVLMCDGNDKYKHFVLYQGSLAFLFIKQVIGIDGGFTVAQNRNIGLEKETCGQNIWLRFQIEAESLSTLYTLYVVIYSNGLELGLSQSSHIYYSKTRSELNLDGTN